MLLCCRQKCVNTLTLFKRNAKELFLQRANSTERHKGAQWLSGGMLDSRRGVVCLSLTSVTALCP